VYHGIGFNDAGVALLSQIEHATNHVKNEFKGQKNDVKGRDNGTNRVIRRRRR
jgi:hypothetical protein